MATLAEWLRSTFPYIEVIRGSTAADSKYDTVQHVSFRVLDEETWLSDGIPELFSELKGKGKHLCQTVVQAKDGSFGYRWNLYVGGDTPEAALEDVTWTGL